VKLLGSRHRLQELLVGWALGQQLGQFAEHFLLVFGQLASSQDGFQHELDRFWGQHRPLAQEVQA
jgi:hypothetical protein